MKQTIRRHFLLTLAISFSLVACNNNDKKAEETTAKDTTAAAPAETTPAAAKIDALAAAPNLYKVLADSLGIRILEATYKPGDSSVMHSHPENAMYVAQGGSAEFIGKDGTKMPVELKTGMSAVRGNDLHSVKNIGKTTMKVILVECNRPSTLMAPDATTDAAKVAAANYKPLHDSLGIRILEVNYKPGQASVLHGHNDLAAYVLQGATAELTDKDGKKNVVEMKTGDAWINGPSVHVGKNLSKTPFKMILFEINRARN